MPFIVGLVNECSDIDKKLKKCSVDIGGEEEVIIVTNAPNVRCGTRTVVALIGTEFEDESKVEVRNVGGVRSHGMLCDSKMLRWQGGAEGICVQVPDTFKPGDVAPSSKPRMDGGVATEPEKSDKELKAEAKAAKKAEAAAKKEARKAKKASKTIDDTPGGADASATVLDGVEKLSVEES